jgi:hypothetical protein
MKRAIKFWNYHLEQRWEFYGEFHNLKKGLAENSNASDDFTF